MSKDKHSLENVMDVALELDEEVNAIGIQAELIADVRVTLGGLHQDMNNVDMDNLKRCFEEFHRKIRMLDSLLFHASKELSDHHENAKYLKDVLHDMAEKERLTGGKDNDEKKIKRI